jgi:hypothetical protein
MALEIRTGATTSAATREALDRTLRLMRDHVGDAASDDDLLDALTGTTVVVAGDRANLSSMEGQQALMTTMALAARSGARVFVDAPNVPIVGVAPPFVGDLLVDAVLDLGTDLIPGVGCFAGRPDAIADLAVVIGDTPWREHARRVVQLEAGVWTGHIASHGGGARLAPTGSPFGALTAAALAAGEAYKAALARLRPHARHSDAFDDLFAPTVEATIALAPDGTPPPTGRLGRIDLVSGGAITQSLLYTLARIPGVAGGGRVIEPETSDLTNLNRYLLLRRSRCGTRKVDDLAALDLGGIALEGLPLRYEEGTLGAIGPLAGTVLVGVDHIPTRWLVQRSQPRWLGIGATSHYAAMASHHEAGTGCAQCLHPHDEPDAGPIPTVAFVSFWAGLWLASLATRHGDGERLSRTMQSVYMTSLRAESPEATWRAPVPPRPECPIGCPL